MTNIDYLVWLDCEQDALDCGRVDSMAEAMEALREGGELVHKDSTLGWVERYQPRMIVRYINHETGETEDEFSHAGEWRQVAA